MMNIYFISFKCAVFLYFVYCFLMVDIGSEYDVGFEYCYVKNMVWRSSSEYLFSDQELSGLIAQHSQVIQMSKIVVDGQDYYPEYAMQDTNYGIILYRGNYGRKIVLRIPLVVKENGRCGMYTDDDGYSKEYLFKCNYRNYFKGGDGSHYVVNHKADGLSLKGVLQIDGPIYQIGSTSFGLGVDNGRVLIKTSNPFPESLYSDGTTLGSGSYFEIKSIVGIAKDVFRNEVIELVFDTEIFGSVHEEFNMYTGLLIRKQGLNTRISRVGAVASGGVSLFLAGVTRSIELTPGSNSFEDGAQLGVHAWSAYEISAPRYCFNTYFHNMVLAYFKMMIGEKGDDYYYFEMASAWADQIYYLSYSDVLNFGIVNGYIAGLE